MRLNDTEKQKKENGEYGEAQFKVQLWTFVKVVQICVREERH